MPAFRVKPLLVMIAGLIACDVKVTKAEAYASTRMGATHQ
jgi:hypothetical protein